MSNRKTKAAASRKIAEELKAKKKQTRMVKAGNQAPSDSKAKGRSSVGQSKKKKK